MQTYNVSRLPSMIKIGYDGENNWRPQAFDCSVLLANHPNGTISLWLLPHGETQAFPVALTRDGNSVIWTPLSEEMTAATGALQIVCTDGTDVGKSAVVMFRVDESIIPGADHPAAVPSWATQTVERAEDAADRAEEAAASIDADHLEQIIAAAVEAYLVEHPIEAPVQSVNGKTGAVRLGASDVGALPANTPIPPAITVDSALSSSSENPVQNKVVTGAMSEKYVKPSTGIPKTDLAADVQTSLGKADTALQSAPVTSVNNKTGAVVLSASDVGALPSSTSVPTKVSDLTNDSNFQTAAQVQSAIAAIPDELPTVTASDNGKFLRVVSGAWAAQAVPIHEPRVAMTASDTTPTLNPNTLYVFPEMASLAITLATPTDTGIVNEYHFIFTSGATDTTLSIPATVNQPDGFSVDANMVYEVSILENNMTAMSWEVSS